jgi:hypothetical protein
VRKSRRAISILLLIIFGVLSLKNLLPHLTEASHGNCDEFGHIHIVHLKHSQTKTIRSQSDHTDDNDENCHSGKSVYSYSLFPTTRYEMIAISHAIVFDVVSTLENHFSSPEIKPLRKPPKIS